MPPPYSMPEKQTIALMVTVLLGTFQVRLRESGTPIPALQDIIDEAIAEYDAVMAQL